jgi:hypothetical protein
LGATVETDACDSSHSPAGPAVWNVHKAAFEPEISWAFDQCLPPSSLCDSRIGDSTYSPEFDRNAVQVRYVRP